MKSAHKGSATLPLVILFYIVIIYKYVNELYAENLVIYQPAGSFSLTPVFVASVLLLEIDRY